LPEVFNCEECGAPIDADEEFTDVGVEVDPRDPGSSRRPGRVHTYLCLLTYRVKHRARLIT
jgi:hypothetical protein